MSLVPKFWTSIALGLAPDVEPHTLKYKKGAPPSEMSMAPVEVKVGCGIYRFGVWTGEVFLPETGGYIKKDRVVAWRPIRRARIRRRMAPEFERLVHKVGCP